VAAAAVVFLGHAVHDDNEFEELPQRETAWQVRDRVAAYRKQLLSAGYRPVPVNGKAPPIQGWQDILATADIIGRWTDQFPDAVNTGVLTAHVPAVDIDVMDGEIAEELEELAERLLGKSAVRIGQAPKRAILYRTDAPFPKLQSTFISPNGQTHKVEILAAGQQIVVNGIHPGTGRPYTWHGGEPGPKLKREDLPLLSADKAAEFISAAAELMTNGGWTPATQVKDKTKGDTGPGSDGAKAGWVRERAYAQAALDGCADELAQTPAGDRNNVLYQKAFRLGTMAARGWISRDEVLEVLLEAAAACGLTPDDGEDKTRRTIKSGLDGSEQKPHPDLEGDTAETWEDAATNTEPLLRPYKPRPFSEIPRRQWLHAGHYIREYVVMTVAPGGYGKTSLILCNMIEMATAKGLLGPAPPAPLRVAYWNAEDPDDEIERRIAAICLRYNIEPACLDNQLFLGSKITNNQRFAMLGKNGTVVFNEKILTQIVEFVHDSHINCIVFDPLIAFHKVPETSSMMQEVIERFSAIAVMAKCCVELSQHTRKPPQGQQGELTADDSRGSGSIVFAARSVRLINRMTGAEAEMPKIKAQDRRRYLRINRDKTNLIPPSAATWIRLGSIDLPNGDNTRPGDNMQVAEPWEYPQAFDSVAEADMYCIRDLVRTNPNYLKNSRSPDWVGIPLAGRLQLDPDDPGDRKRLAEILRSWFDNRVLATEIRQNEHRHDREFVVPGPWNDEPEGTP
jgi:hypothetical protein